MFKLKMANNDLRTTHFT